MYVPLETLGVMCIPNTFSFEHVEARVEVGEGRTSVALLAEGGER
jgi:hypothetical protein